MIWSEEFFFLGGGYFNIARWGIFPHISETNDHVFVKISANFFGQGSLH